MKRTKKLIITAISLLIAGMAIAFTLFYTFFIADGISRDGFLYIPTGSTFENVVDSLSNGAVEIKSPARFRRVASMLKYRTPKAGRYKIEDNMSYISLVRMLRAGNQTPIKVTFNNVRTLGQLAGRIAENLEIDSLAMYAALTDDSITHALGYQPETMIAMFIPNTYEMYWNNSPESVIIRMKREHDKFWNEERKAKLAASGLSETEAMTLASIVYEETKMRSEMPTVAGVYINRLKIGMPLQADPTVKFAIGDFSLRRILNRHLEVDSPYNTYRNAGLPPGPICMPTIAAIDAVLNYQRHNYLYFCAAPDLSGKHRFATNLAEHSRNAQEYARELNRQKIFR